MSRNTELLCELSKIKALTQVGYFSPAERDAEIIDALAYAIDDPLVYRQIEAITGRTPCLPLDWTTGSRRAHRRLGGQRTGNGET